MSQEIDQAQYDSQILQSPIPVLLDLYGEHCGPCRQLAPLLDRLAIDYEGRAKVVMLNASANHELAGRLAVSAVPTVVAFRDGREVGRLVGLRPESAYRHLLESAGAS